MSSQEKATTPYKLIALPLSSGDQGTHYNHAYIKHDQYAEDPRHYVAAIRLIENDLQEIFEYVEPAEVNSATFSHRIHQLLFRSCVEIEAHFRNILTSNGFNPPGTRQNLDMRDYKLVENTHLLSEYRVRYPGWRGENVQWQPFNNWINCPPSWWDAYNGSKHDRGSNFKEANLKNLMGAVAGLIALHHAQYMEEDFSSVSGVLSTGGGGFDSNDGMKTAIMRPFRIAYPRREAYAIIYDFDWQDVRRKDEPIASYNYAQHVSKIKS